jgi:hypothetical protein
MNQSTGDMIRAGAWGAVGALLVYGTIGLVVSVIERQRPRPAAAPAGGCGCGCGGK